MIDDEPERLSSFALLWVKDKITVERLSTAKTSNSHINNSIKAEKYTGNFILKDNHLRDTTGYVEVGGCKQGRQEPPLYT